jgi:hypothetical protein
MTAEREALADRVRTALPQDRPVREVSMFGRLSFMVDDRMVVAVGRDGDLLVRIDPARNDELLTVPGAKPAVMGADRPGTGLDHRLSRWPHHRRATRLLDPSRFGSPSRTGKEPSWIEDSVAGRWGKRGARIKTAWDI